ncbi:MAG TPA: phosphatase PAP2 family protein [Herpetosiphonaceae bacterium]|nr:phosphatase PAP2 family protein [Herpetosiphonaceae bacterium]
MKAGAGAAGGWPAWRSCFLAQRWAIAAALLSFIGYFGTSRIPGLTVHRVPATAIDRFIPLLPITAYGYVSLYPLLLGNLAWLMPHPPALLPLLKAFILANTLSGIWFVCYRTTVDRPPLPDGAGAGLLGLVWSADPPFNALPSLHTAYSLLIASAHLRWRSRVRWPITAWAAVIIATTLTTKQHVFLDVVAGAIFAAPIIRWMFGSLRPGQLEAGADYQ